MRNKLSREAPEWVNAKALRDPLGKRRELFAQAVEMLLDTGPGEVQEVMHGRNPVTQYRLKHDGPANSQGA